MPIEGRWTVKSCPRQWVTYKGTNVQVWVQFFESPFPSQRHIPYDVVDLIYGVCEGNPAVSPIHSHIVIVKEAKALKDGQNYLGRFWLAR